MPAKVARAAAGGEATVETEWAPKVSATVSTSQLKPINHTTNIDDMVQFAHLHDAALLHNVQLRYHEEQMYSRAGPIMIAVNPYKFIKDADGVVIYDPVYIRRYRDRVPPHMLDAMPAARRAKARLPPHIFGVAR